jgi:hypothetical protein
MTEPTAIEIAMGAAGTSDPSAIDIAMGKTGEEDNNIGYLQQVHLDKKKKEREKKEAIAPIKTDTLSESISRELGVPDGMVDDSGAGFRMRANFSFSDTDEDMREKFKKMYPNGEIYRLEYNQAGTYKDTGDSFLSRNKSSVLVYRENAYDEDGNVLPITESSKVKTIEGAGGGYADIADIAGPSLPMAGSIAVGTLSPPGVLLGALHFGVGYAAGELAKHEINIFAYDSDLSQKEALADAAKEGAEMSVLLAVTGGLYKGAKAVVQRGAKVAMSDASAEIKAIRQRAMTFVESQRGRVATMTAPQVAPENAILERLGSQASSTSAEARHRAVAQQTGPANVLQEDLVKTQETIGAQIAATVRRVYNQTKNTIRTAVFGHRKTTLEEGGTALTQGGQAWVKQEGPRGKLGVEYTKLDAAAEQAKPVFTLNVPVSEGRLSAKQQVYEINNAVNAEVKALEVAGMNVAETPIGKLSTVLREIDRASGIQFNYEVIKQWRTRVGDVIAQWPWNSSINSHHARNLYGTLSDIMMSPVNANPMTRAFTLQAARANGMSRAYYQMLDDPAVRKIIQSTSPAMLAADIGTPLHLTPNVRTMIEQMPGDYARKFKDATLVHDILLNPSGATQSLDNWVVNHPEGWSFLVGKDKVLGRAVKEAARSMDDLRASNLYVAMDAATKNREMAAKLLRAPGTGPNETKALVESVGEQGRQKLREGIYHDIVDSVVTEGKKGIPMVDGAALKGIIKEYEATGAWQHVLTQADRVHLLGMKSYIDLVYKGAADAGVSLEAAKAITELKKPSTFISGAHKLTVNALAARVIMNPKFVEWVMYHNLGKPIVLNTARSKVRFIGLITEALVEGTEPGQNFDPFSDRTDSAMDFISDIDTNIVPVIDRLSELQIPQG